MKKQRFFIGERDWMVTALYDIRTDDDFDEMEVQLLMCGSGLRSAEEAVAVLHGSNKGYTFTNYETRSSVMAMGKATSGAQMFDSIVHELKHLVEHVSSYYGLDPKEELAAYLQGEVGRQMFPVVAAVICDYSAWGNHAARCL